MKSGKYIKKVRSVAGITQSEMAQKLEVSQAYVSQIERGVIDISLSSFIEICRKTGISDFNEVLKD